MLLQICNRYEKMVSLRSTGKSVIRNNYLCIYCISGRSTVVWFEAHFIHSNAKSFSIIGTLNFSKRCAAKYWGQSVPVTINEFLIHLYWNFGPLFFCQLLWVSQIWRVPSPNCCFMGFRSGLIAGHFRTLQCFILNHLCMPYGCFGSLSAGRVMTSDGDPDS